jgi:hypothetical protein
MEGLKNVITGEEIVLPQWNKSKVLRNLGIDPSNYFHLRSGKINHIKHKFILLGSNPEFSLVEFDSGKEYPCASNSSIFIHFNIPYNENDTKYVFAVKSKRQRLVTINNTVLYLKGEEPKKYSVNLKSKSIKSNNLLFIEARKTKFFRRMCFRIKKQFQIKKIKPIGLSACRELLGCDKNTLFSHIESHFESGMSWDNRSSKTWHVDHIEPMGTIDLLNDTDLRRVCHYTNLRPLWSTTKVAISFGSNSIGNLNRPRKISFPNLPVSTIP